MRKIWQVETESTYTSEIFLIEKWEHLVSERNIGKVRLSIIEKL
jgi:hypothetical protein